MIPTLTDLILGMCCSLVFSVIYTAIKNRKERRNRESRERQAKLEAFWKEEQLRLNPRAVLVDRLPPVEKHPEWAYKQHYVQLDRLRQVARQELFDRISMFTSNRDEDISRQLEELKDFWK